MIVISPNLVLAEVQSYSPNNPVVGWRSILSIDNLVADSEDMLYPAVNLVNPATYLFWRSGTADAQYITITTNSADDVDYVAIARHNFFSAGIAVGVEGYDGTTWTELIEPTMLPDDGPALFRFSPSPFVQLRLALEPSGDDAPRLAVLYVGLLLVMERGLYVGHTPLKYARRVDVVNGRSESGEFLGRIITGSFQESPAKFTLLDPDWYREYLDPFVASAQERPFFFAWRPDEYPLEVGYGIIINDPQPVPTDPAHLIEIEFQMRGVS